MGPDTDPDEGWRSEIGERRSEKGRRGHGTTDHGLRFFLRFHPCSSGFICGLISSGLSFNAEGAEVRRGFFFSAFLCVSALRMVPFLVCGLGSPTGCLLSPALSSRGGKRGGRGAGSSVWRAAVRCPTHERGTILLPLFHSEWRGARRERMQPVPGWGIVCGGCHPG